MKLAIFIAIALSCLVDHARAKYISCRKICTEEVRKTCETNYLAYDDNRCKDCDENGCMWNLEKANIGNITKTMEKSNNTHCIVVLNRVKNNE